MPTVAWIIIGGVSIVTGLIAWLELYLFGDGE